ncbi:unnamed protein product [Vicia faba]|uniref:TF-B3 domain-containing protein n=1 Tax=Vicia faba TaxID=3906 RepID=A0AAV0Z9T0_VICFA|nr:unnamed protein product [Vicia faba]
MSSPILKGFIPLNTDQLYGMLLNIKEEPQTPNVPPEVMFPKINATLKEVKKEIEVGQPSNAKNNVGDLEKEVSFIKEISKSGSRGNQVFHFPAEVRLKALCPDITSCLIRDFDMGEYLPCKIIKSNKTNGEMSLGKGWYSFAKSKKLKVGDKFHCTYRSGEEILYVRLQRKGK